MKILIAIPACNESLVLEKNILKLHSFCSDFLRDEWMIVIADNASTDATFEIGKKIAETYKKIRFLRMEEKGKGRAIRKAWSAFSDADIFAFMDADLATDLETFPALVSAIAEERFDIALGSRALPNSCTQRSFVRRTLSKGYQILSRLFLRTNITDLPCGFKAVNKKTIREIVPFVENDGWFFDSEMTLLAERKNYRIKEVPVVWKNISERASTVPLWSVVVSYVKEMRRLKKKFKNSRR